ncbi:MAG: DUF4159 domain-containing protein [Anaerolineae bacterium]
MNREQLLQQFPAKRIAPADGLAVTATVWEEAHRYHHLHQRFHTLLSHGAGILVGLEVIASDPPDSAVHVLPGIAIDSQGQTIVLPELMAYDLRDAQGQLYLLLTYEESEPLAGDGDQEGPLYVHSWFGIEARPDRPDTPYVELARIHRHDRGAPVRDARDADHPAANEIDTRFRREVAAEPRETVRIAVSYASGPQGRRHGQGADHLARALRREGQAVWVDDGLRLTDGLEGYTLLYLVGQEAFQMSRDEMNALYAFLQDGGTVFVESCHHEIGDEAAPADVSYADLLATLGIELQELAPGDRLLAEPFLFGAPPPGFETEGVPQLRAGDGVILSTFDYGCLWAGARRDGPASRQEIRAAHEWGANLLAYAQARRRRARA